MAKVFIWSTAKLAICVSVPFRSLTQRTMEHFTLHLTWNCLVGWCMGFHSDLLKLPLVSHRERSVWHTLQVTEVCQFTFRVEVQSILNSTYKNFSIPTNAWLVMNTNIFSFGKRLSPNFTFLLGIHLSLAITLVLLVEVLWVGQRTNDPGDTTYKTKSGHLRIIVNSSHLCLTWQKQIEAISLAGTRITGSKQLSEEGITKKAILMTYLY